MSFGVIGRLGLIAGFVVASTALAAADEIPAEDPDLFRQMFNQGLVSADWIEPAAREELSVDLLQGIAERWRSELGRYQGADRTAVGWRLTFEKGEIRGRVARSRDGRLIGVFFGK